jgi:hypothetical protein
VIEVTTSADCWDVWRSEVGLDDVYYDLRYLEVWQDWERGEAVGVRFTHPLGTVLFPVIRVPLDRLAGGGGAVDLRTAYDFGGPLAFGERPGELIAAFDRVWTKVVESWGGVTEFCRLHPFRCRHRPAGASFHAANYVVELAGDPGAIWARLHPTHRRQVRRARRDGLRARVHGSPSPEQAGAFATLYGETMERVDGAAFYRFPRRLLTRLLALDEVCLVEVDDAAGPVAMALFLASGRELFYFLGASTRHAALATPSALLHDEARRFACAQGFERIHYGGGSEGVRGFKSRLADSQVPYYVVRRIHDVRAYERILAATGCRDAGEFPPYRSLLFKSPPELC